MPQFKDSRHSWSSLSRQEIGILARMASFGDRVRKARKAAGLTGQQLADALHVSKGSISLWENNRSTPGFDLLPALCRKLRVSLDYLVLGVSGVLSPQAIELAKEFDRLSPTEQSRFHAALALVRGSSTFTDFPDVSEPIKKH